MNTQGILATKNYIHAYPRYFCYQKLHTCIFKYFCYLKLHTCIFKYFCYLNYIHLGWHFCYFIHILFIYIPLRSPSHAIHILAFIWKTISYYTFMEKIEIFLLVIHTLQSHFMPYAPILRSIFGLSSAHRHIGKALGYLSHMYAWFNKCLPLASYSMTNISTSSRRK